MSKTGHRIFILTLSAIIVFVLVALLLTGISYYDTPIDQRFFHPDYETLKPSGSLGHGLGIVGTFLIIFGVGSYMSRKRFRFLNRLGLLKYWLEFHIFLCTLGPIMVLYHTSFKFGGVVAISFWSMVAVFLSGVAGRFIYLQIPRSREGRALSLAEVRSMKTDMHAILADIPSLDKEEQRQILEFTNPSIVIEGLGRRKKRHMAKKSMADIKALLKKTDISASEYNKLIRLVRRENKLNARIARLDMMQNLFKYWHVAHLPFALVMLIIMLIHVGITISLGYKWVF